MKTFEASAPSNIALIKYMGKADSGQNQAANPSLSLTLEGFRTFVRVGIQEVASGGTIEILPLRRAGLQTPNFSEAGLNKFKRHAERVIHALKPGFDFSKHSITVESGNDFPSDCGLASSASSFAALTLALQGVLSTDTSLENLAGLSREGSGSSCRSFFGPWVEWDQEQVSIQPKLPLAEEIYHLAIVVDSKKKEVSSSEAHRKIQTSLLYQGRAERAQIRLKDVKQCLIESRLLNMSGDKAWDRAADLVLAESNDMHALFETAMPPFNYRSENSLRVLGEIQRLDLQYKTVVEEASPARLWRRPLVTMDAGPNVHLIFSRGVDPQILSQYLFDLKKLVGVYATLLEGQQRLASQRYDVQSELG